uniref:Uncharacterized protein n=1 Tax=Attheya septentrionalis TaxID=420275 RepID=A0A7S2URU1_9STRA|mmetsp:Transcript_9829/g.17886  ORF Transcript_9829/g.17886 Transcript_9829/m.17886 type:complete len:585 (+) Transcript_9829:269-2023(+)
MPTMCNNPYKRSVQTSDLNAAESLLFLTASITPKKRSIVSVGTPSSIIPKRRSHTSLLPSPTTNIVHAGPTYVDRNNITFSTPTPTINNKMAPVSHSPFSRGTTPFSFVTTAPCLRRMINDFKSSVVDNRGRGSNFPQNAIDSILAADSVPCNITSLRAVPHVGKVLVQKHGPKILSICKQYLSDLSKWQSQQTSNVLSDEFFGATNASNVDKHIGKIGPDTFLDFLRPPVPDGPVKDMYFSACKQALNEFNIVGKVAVDPILRSSRNSTSNANSVPASETEISFPTAPSFFVNPLNARRASIEDIMQVSPGTALQLLVPTHYKTKKAGAPMSAIRNNYCSQHGISDYDQFSTVVFSGVQYLVMPAIVRANPKRDDILGGLIRKSDIQRLYAQKEGISIDMPSLTKSVSLWWHQINPHSERYPIIVWGNFEYARCNYNSIFRASHDAKRNLHLFSLVKLETATDVGSTYALIKAFQSIQSNETRRTVRRHSTSDNGKDSGFKINLRNRIVVQFLKNADTVFVEAIEACETDFAYPGCPIVTLNEINKLVVIFYHTLPQIYNWQYCLSVGLRTSTLSNVYKAAFP